MSQTSVADQPVRAYEGKVHVSGEYPTSYLSRLASGAVYFGKAVVPYDDAELALGEQRAKLPAAAADVPRLLGVAIADVTKEPVASTYGGYADKDSVTIMRKGQIWVVSVDQVTDLDAGVYIRHANGAAPPAGTLGSFRATVDVDYTLFAGEGLKWLAAETIGSVYFGLLEVNLP
jgi:hypothetical protein